LNPHVAVGPEAPADTSRVWPWDLMAGLMAVAFLCFGVSLEWETLLDTLGFPADKLRHPRVQGELRLVRSLSLTVAVAIAVSRLALRRRRNALIAVSQEIDHAISSAVQSRIVVPLILATLVLAKTGLQLTLYLLGYTAFAADDFGRTLKADYWLQHPRLDLGLEGWVGLGGSAWLPFPDYLFGLGLALHRDLFLTPKLVNLCVSGILVVVIYVLARELFGRTAGCLAATVVALQPWNVWLGMSGMTSDLPSVVLIGLFGLFLFRWLESDRASALLAAASCLLAAAGFRYENWFFSLVFSLLVALDVLGRWMRGGVPWSAIGAGACAIALASAVPVVWMTASYVTLGDWLPALHQTTTLILSVETARTTMSIPILALASYPFEVTLAIAGGVVAWRVDRRRSIRLYLVMVFMTLLLFSIVLKGQMRTHARVLFPYVALVLPHAGLLMARLLRAPRGERIQWRLAGTVLVLAVVAFGILRAFNYPTGFPQDAIYAGWAMRGLQATGSVRADSRVLIERSPDWSHLGIVALANRPERFTLFETGMPPGMCESELREASCRQGLRERGFDFVIVSSEARRFTFERILPAPIWQAGRYRIFNVRED
jgi:Dolichyl-phosphate-mannose-protein mannosyltransferase